jgi:hypothetical protein
MNDLVNAVEKIPEGVDGRDEHRRTTSSGEGLSRPD